MTVAEAPAVPGRALTLDELATVRQFVESLAGRPLRPAEHVIDVIRLNGAMQAAKDEIEQAVRDEQRKAAKRWLRAGGPIRLNVTRPMLRPLETLFLLGREEGYHELVRLGIDARQPDRIRRYEDKPFRRKMDPLEALWLEVRRRLNGIGIRVHNGLVQADLSSVSATAIAQALMNLPGGRALAADVISTALARGFAQTFELNKDLVPRWEISAVLDGGTCGPCAEHDGEQFDSWDAIQVLLPDGGPAVYCDGGDRCRCRPVPAA